MNYKRTFSLGYICRLNIHEVCQLQAIPVQMMMMRGAKRNDTTNDSEDRQRGRVRTKVRTSCVIWRTRVHPDASMVIE